MNLQSEQIGLSVAQLYVAFFNRTPDLGGFTYWTNSLTNNFSINSIAQSFADSTEFHNLYPSLNTTQYITAIYENIFNRTPDMDGLAYWSNALNSKTVTDGGLLTSIISAAMSQGASSADYQSAYYKGGFGSWCVGVNIPVAVGSAQLGAINNLVTETATQAKIQTTSSPVLTSFVDAGVKTDVSTLLGSSSSLGYDSVLKILYDVAVNGITTSEFQDLQTLVANFNVIGGIQVSSYVQNISYKLIIGDAANAHWSGGAMSSTALGNLTSSSSQIQMNELIQKWFLGGDLPIPIFDNNVTASYVQNNNPLFNTSNAPSLDDINQGYNLGDCYLLASIAEVAMREPSIIESMITNNNNGTYGVKFVVNGTPTYVTVSNNLPGNGGHVANYSASDIWASVIEKAYVQLNEEPGILPHTSGNEWALISGGFADPITEITGKNTLSFGSSSYSADSWAVFKTNVILAIQNNSEILFASWGNAIDVSGQKTLIAGHMFAVIGYDATTGDFVLFNPWGHEQAQYWDTTFEVSMSDLQNIAQGTFYIAVSTQGTTATPTNNNFSSPNKAIEVNYGSNIAFPDAISFNAGKVIADNVIASCGDLTTLEGWVNGALTVKGANIASHSISWFNFNGNTYLIEQAHTQGSSFAMDASSIGSKNTLIKLTGVLDESHATLNGHTLTL